jgi:hypothetical protein
MAIELGKGQTFVALIGRKMLFHIETVSRRAGYTVCGRKIPRVAVRCDRPSPGKGLCANCLRMKDADTMRLRGTSPGACNCC